MPFRTLLPILFVLLAVAGAAYAISTKSAVYRAWKPLIALSGGREIPEAVKWLKELAEFRALLVEEPKFDGKTKKFIDDLFEALKDFDLEDYYDLLPEKVGDDRRLSISGSLVGSTYKIKQASAGMDFEVKPEGKRRALGDMSMVIQAREVPKGDDGVNYLLETRQGVIIGVIDWASIVESNVEMMRLMASGDPTSPAFTRSEISRGPSWARYKVIKTHRMLGPEDVEILAIGWSAFPRVTEILNRLVRVEDLVVVDRKAKGAYQHLRPTFKLALSSLINKYPHVGAWLEDLGFIDAQIKINLTDESGSLVRFDIDTKNRRVGFDMYVKDGMILPVLNGRVRIDHPIDINARPRLKPWRLLSILEAQSNTMGLKTVIRNYRTRFDFRANARGAVVKSRTTDIPEISITGNALGLIPAGLIDLFIPGSLESLTRDFVATACKGNNGEGIVIDTRVDQPAPGIPATFDIRTVFEGTDNFLVKFGVSVMNEKVIPSQEVMGDLRKILRDVHHAFMADLDRFSTIDHSS
ncbi:MAG: hypothetical protein JXA30_16425 [Deltaproteobacteria bacterium]|nr:hypothetical protein [Deltaproteobacteria bacterium]